jgi:hypothetical protein
VVTPDGIKVEVKTSAYLQSWTQKKLSAISFDIGPKQRGDVAQNTVAGPPTRFAEVYVFALLAQTDKATLEPLDVNQWQFFVLPTAVLNERCPKQKQISLGSLLKLGPTRVSYAGLAQAIRRNTGSSEHCLTPSVNGDAVQFRKVEIPRMRSRKAECGSASAR